MSDQKRFTLRMDMDIFEKVEEQAKNNKRSIAKEIEYILERYLDDESKENEE